MTDKKLEQANRLKSQIKAAWARLEAVKKAKKLAVQLADPASGSVEILLHAPGYAAFDKTIFGSQETLMKPLFEDFFKTARDILEKKIIDLNNEFANL